VFYRHATISGPFHPWFSLFFIHKSNPHSAKAAGIGKFFGWSIKKTWRGNSELF
jgi:hypothetical protein